MSSMRNEDDVIQIRRLLRGRFYTRTIPIEGDVSPPEAAVLLNVGLRHVYRLIAKGKLPKRRRNGKIVIPCHALIARQRSKG